jgi:hypothetical protein
MSRKQKLLHLAFLLMLLIVSISIDLLHNEKGPGATSSCPACTFLQSTIADSIIISISIPLPAAGGLIELFETQGHEIALSASLAARSPPGA